MGGDTWSLWLPGRPWSGSMDTVPIVHRNSQSEAWPKFFVWSCVRIASWLPWSTHLIPIRLSLHSNYHCGQGPLKKSPPVPAFGSPTRSPRRLCDVHKEGSFSSFWGGSCACSTPFTVWLHLDSGFIRIG